MQSAPAASFYLTLLGIFAGFFSTAWSFRYILTSRRMFMYLEAEPGEAVRKIDKANVSVIT